MKSVITRMVETLTWPTSHSPTALTNLLRIMLFFVLKSFLTVMFSRFTLLYSIFTSDTSIHSTESTFITIFFMFNINWALRWMWPVPWKASKDFNLHSPGITSVYEWPRTRIQQARGKALNRWRWWMDSKAAFLFSWTGKVRYILRAGR